MKSKLFCLLLLTGGLLSGCSTPVPLMDTSAETRYLIGEGDQVNIVVSGEPDMTMRFMVDNSGNINFPYIGPLQLTGKAPQDIAVDITQRLSEGYLQNPMVTVSISQFRKFYVTGEVKKPDGYFYEPGLTVQKALALGGGFTDRADRKDISIRLSENNTLLENVDIRHSVHPGDTVIVGMSFF